MPGPVLLVGVGNDHRGDDGAGLAVARLLKAKAVPGATIIEATGDGTALLEAWRGYDAVYLFDAVTSGAAPGSVHRLDVSERALPADVVATTSHAFGVAEAIELARSLGQTPRRLVVYGIEGKAFEVGEGLSAQVERAVRDVAEQVLLELSALR